MATELERRGCDLTGPLWSAKVLEIAPEKIADVHREYLEAGADCIGTASYQISSLGFVELGRPPADAAHALRASVAIAENARRTYETHSKRRIWIAASLGPYGAALHNGAEYHGIYDCDFDSLVQFHAGRLAVLRHTSADFIAFETIPSQQEAAAILAALHQFPGLPASITFTCRDTRRVAHGERLSECARLLDQEPQIVGTGINCTHPELILPLIHELKSSTSKRIPVYPNSGERWDMQNRCWIGDGETANFGELARSWRDAGADWIGGCCRTGPEQIRVIAHLWPSMVSGSMVPRPDPVA
jgi:homocysteine S-methyltransferase